MGRPQSCATREDYIYIFLFFLLFFIFWGLVKRAVPAPDPSEAPRPGHGIPHMERAHPNLSNNAGFPYKLINVCYNLDSFFGIEFVFVFVFVLFSGCGWASSREVIGGASGGERFHRKGVSLNRSVGLC